MFSAGTDKVVSRESCNLYIVSYAIGAASFAVYETHPEYSGVFFGKKKKTPKKKGTIKFPLKKSLSAVTM